MTTSNNSTDMESQPTLFVEDSLARTSVSPDLETASTGIVADCGLKWRESFARFDPVTSSWRTWQRSLYEEWSEFSETFPTSGSMLNGQLYRRAPWVLHTCDSECSLWPTPTASMDGRGFGIPRHERTGRYKRATVLRVHALVNEHGWRIHPHFTEELMGFPTDWTAIEESETP